MDLQPNHDSLFLRLLPGRRTRGGHVGATGHEEYVTQILGAVLEADPGLTRLMLREWVGDLIDVDEGTSPVVATEVDASAHSDTGERSRIDLVLEVPGHLIFVENKVGAGLNKYETVLDGKQIAEDQVQRYHRVLDAESGARMGHLIVLAQKPVASYALPLYRGHRHWWDLYAVIQRRLEASDLPPAARYLEQALLRFLDEVHRWAASSACSVAITLRRTSVVGGSVSLDAVERQRRSSWTRRGTRTDG